MTRTHLVATMAGVLLIAMAAIAQSALPETGVVEQYIEQHGTLPNADVDVPAHAFVAQNAVNGTAFRALNNGCIDLGSGAQDHICASGNEFTVGATTHLPTTFMTQPACPANTTCRWYSDRWFGYFPIANVPTCDAATAGGVMVHSAANSVKYCDGSTVWNVGLELNNGAVLDFPSISENQQEELTLTVTGAEVGKAVHCNPVNDLELGLVIAYVRVSAGNTVKVVLRNTFVGSGSIDPASNTYVCKVWR